MPAPAVFLHGFMGGSLWSTRGSAYLKEWWLTLPNALPHAVGRLERAVKLPGGDGLRPRSSLPSVGPELVYGELQAFFTQRGYRWIAYDDAAVAAGAAHAAQQPRVVDCAFDWRKGLGVAAQRLADLVEDSRHAGLWDGQQPVILAHSHGGLVARHYVENLGGAAHVARVVTFGTPHRGLLKTFKGMVDGLRIALIAPARVRRMARTFPSCAELMPAPPALHGSPHLYYDANMQAADPLADRSWVPAEDRATMEALLDDAAPVIAAMPRASAVPLDVVCGIGLPTLDYAYWDAGKLRFRYSRLGDATSPLASQVWPEGPAVRRFAVPCGIGGGLDPRFRQLDVQHARLFDDWDARRLIDRVLGLTSGFQREPVAHISDWRALPGARIGVTVVGQDEYGAPLPGFDHRVSFEGQQAQGSAVPGVPGAFQATLRMPNPAGRDFRVEVHARWDGWSDTRLILKRSLRPIETGRMLSYEEADRRGIAFAPTDGEQLMLSLL